jgi:2-hydroxy-3-keto-5-methylthiopentenyl-1-phosphate phosphatase
MAAKTIDDVYINSFNIVCNKYKSLLNSVSIDFGLARDHILSRAKQRRLSVDYCFDALNKTYRHKLCELIFAMVQGRYCTIELRYKNVIVVISRRFVPGNHSWYVSTILDSKIHSLNREGLSDEVYQIILD